ncbi:MAG: hypothetical protein ACOCP9_07170 [Halofilum sp. (in: g-proteobacteria)]
MPTRAAPSLITVLRVGAIHTPDTIDATEILIADGRIAALGTTSSSRPAGPSRSSTPRN